MRLVHANGVLVEAGDRVVDFRGSRAQVVGWAAPRHPGSSGRVVVSFTGDEAAVREYYPTVFGLEWTSTEE
jgi:hypothetical protein